MTWHRIGRTTEHPQGMARYLIRGSHLYIFCDGTATLQQWRWNFTTLTRRLSDGSRANRKDYAQAVEVAAELYMELDLWGFEQITIGGLSRGGAIAVLLAWYMARFNSQITVFAFAGKRVGNRKLMDQVNHSNLWQRGDVVPWLPFRYASYRGRMTVKPLTWPWKAHLWAAHQAAYWRHELTQGGEDDL